MPVPNTVSRFLFARASFRNKQYTGAVTGHRGLRLVRYPNLDRRFSVYQMLRVWIPSLETLPQVFPDSFGLQTGPAICFLLFWFAEYVGGLSGVESIRKLLVFKAFFSSAGGPGFIVLGHQCRQCGLGLILSQPARLTGAAFWNYFFPALTGMVGFWATLSLNIPDFTCYARNQKAQINGQIIGLPHP